jgi:glycosyltransferase involved in cell wall biosynthesis
LHKLRGDLILSIIIPVYNVERYLRQCLESVYTQCLKDCEVILVNDGSTDGSLAILEEFSRLYSPFTTLVSKSNGGLSSARNAGLDIAHGEYVFFIDSDDYLLPNGIKTILSSINKYPSDILYFDSVITNKGNRLVVFPFPIREESDSVSFFNYLYQRHITILPNAFAYVLSRSFLLQKQLKYTEGLTHEDALYKYQLYLSGGSICAIHVDSPIYTYRIGREGSISTQKKIKNFIDQHLIRKKVDLLIIENKIHGACFYNSLFQAYINCMIEASDSGLLSSRELFFDKEDKRIMRKGIMTPFEYKLWLLACIKPELLVKYLEKKLSETHRRFINIVASSICFLNEKIRRI